MIALDTNVLVRYIIRDDPDQTMRATELIEGLTKQTCGFITAIVLSELDWVLKSAYKLKKMERILIVDNVLSASVFEVENLVSCVRALRSFEEGNADYSDYLIEQLAYESGCSTVVTFDKEALKSKGFSSP